MRKFVAVLTCGLALTSCSNVGTKISDTKESKVLHPDEDGTEYLEIANVHLKPVQGIYVRAKIGSEAILRYRDSQGESPIQLVLPNGYVSKVFEDSSRTYIQGTKRIGNDGEWQFGLGKQINKADSSPPQLLFCNDTCDVIYDLRNPSRGLNASVSVAFLDQMNFRGLSLIAWTFPGTRKRTLKSGELLWLSGFRDAEIATPIMDRIKEVTKNFDKPLELYLELERDYPGVNMPGHVGMARSQVELFQDIFLTDKPTSTVRLKMANYANDDGDNVAEFYDLGHVTLEL